MDLAHFLAGVFLAWIPLLALTHTLIVRRKALVPVLTGLTSPGFNAVCMDRRVWEDLEREESWRLPGGAYAFGLPIIWTAAAAFFLVIGLTPLAWFFALFAAYQFFFAAPLIVLGLIKGFLVGFLTDETTFHLEMHKHICKAVAVTDPFAAALTLVHLARPENPLAGEEVIDFFTEIHWVDVVPFIAVLYLTANFGRLVSTYGWRPWVKIRPGWSEMEGER